MLPSVTQHNQMMGSRMDDMAAQQQQAQSLHDLSATQGSTPIQHSNGLDEDESETGMWKQKCVIFQSIFELVANSWLNQPQTLWQH